MCVLRTNIQNVYVGASKENKKKRSTTSENFAMKLIKNLLANKRKIFNKRNELVVNTRV